MNKVSFIEYEAMQARTERKVKRLLISILIMVTAIVGSNIFWLSRFIG